MNLTQTTVNVPGIDEPLSLTLPPSLQGLRDKALKLQNDRWDYWISDLFSLESELAAWREHTEDEDWRIWRARRFVAKTSSMPLELESGNLVVGRPATTAATEDQKKRMDYIRETMVKEASYPGGDAGHFHPNYDTILTLGVGGILDKIARKRAECEGDPDKQTFYDSCRIAMEGFQAYILRLADECDVMAAADPEVADDWREMGALCRRISVDPPQTFHEACQMMFMVLVTAWFCEDHGMACYGRMDRTLGRFYDADIAAGRTTPKQALNIVCSMYIQMNRICPANLADGVIVGGRDGSGEDVTNTLSYICLAARQATWLCFPTLAIAWHDGTPSEMMEFSLQMLSSGINDPAFFSDDVIPGGLQDLGVSVEDSHNFMNSTCVEIKTVGNGNIWVACRYFNCAASLLEAMRQEVDGECEPAKTLDELQDRAKTFIAGQIGETAANLVEGWEHRAERGCMPFASCIIDDCLDIGLDHDRGGCRYGWVENSFVGLANLTDAIIAVDELVFRNGEMTVSEFYAICQNNFEGSEPLRQRILNDFPSYGNDDDRADAVAVEWADFLCETSESFTIAGQPFVPGFFCHMNHAWLGLETAATPDGRLAGIAFADGAGAAQGRELVGPTASALSTTKWSHRKALGGLVHNARFSDAMFATAANRQAVRTVIETFLRRGGFEIQINVLSADTLRAAQEHPEQYQDLVVRVAGYSDYFTTLTPELQAEVIARTEFETM
jgi:trans-4-hydroxy-L-proline dehydratase